MFCLYCGNNLPDDAVFCNKCGRRQNAATNKSEIDVVVVPFPPFPQASINSGQPAIGNVPVVQGTPSALDNSPGQDSIQRPANTAPATSPSTAPAPAKSTEPLTPFQESRQQVQPTNYPYSQHGQKTEPSQYLHQAQPQMITGAKTAGHISRRAVLVGLTGAVGVAVIGGSIGLLSRRTPPIGTTLLTYRGNSSTISSVAWSPDGKYIVSGSYRDKAQVFDATTGTNILTYRGNADAVFVVAWSHDGKRIASVGGDNATGADGKPVPQDDTVQIWDALTGGNVLFYRGHSSWVLNLVWSPDGTRIASSAVTESTVKIWNATTANTLLTYEGQSNEIITSVVWSPNGQYIASAGYTGTGQSGTIQIWDPSTAANMLTIPNNYGDLAWSPDSKNLVSTANSKLQIWDASTGALVKDLGDSSNAFVVAWSHDGKRIAFGGGDRSTNKFPIQVVDAITGNHIYTYNGHSNYVFAIAWAPDDNRIASGSDDATVQVWQAI